MSEGVSVVLGEVCPLLLFIGVVGVVLPGVPVPLVEPELLGIARPLFGSVVPGGRWPGVPRIGSDEPGVLCAPGPFVESVLPGGLWVPGLLVEPDGRLSSIVPGVPVLPIAPGDPVVAGSVEPAPFMPPVVGPVVDVLGSTGVVVC